MSDFTPTIDDLRRLAQEAAARPGACQKPVRPTRGPWHVLVPPQPTGGALMIQDKAGTIIGWATDAIGTIADDGEPWNREPTQIARNAALMAQAPSMLLVCHAVAAWIADQAAQGNAPKVPPLSALGFALATDIVRQFPK